MIRAFGAFVVSVAILWLMDAAVFRGPFYMGLLEPASSTGIYEETLARERRVQDRSADNLILTMGDSRFGYLPRLANQFTGRSGYVFTSAGVAGSTTRALFYLLRDLDPEANRYRAIVLGVDDYDDEDGFVDLPNDTRDLRMAIARLRLADVAEYTLSYPASARRWDAVRGSLFKGFVLQQDVHAFLAHPEQRLASVRLYREGWDHWTYDYVEEERTLAGLSVDWPNWKATLPAGADPVQAVTVRDALMRPAAPQTGRFAAYRRLWYGRILDRYKGSRSKVVFVRLARGPFVRPEGLVKKLSGSIREFTARPGVILCNEHAFESLERPEFFKDALHLNRDGCVRFSEMLVDEIARVLGPPPGFGR